MSVWSKLSKDDACIKETTKRKPIPMNKESI